MSLPSHLQTYLASYHISKLDVKRDKDLIITEVLNKGDEEALEWITNTYSKNEIRQIISSPIKGMWLKKTLRYWLSIFNINLSEDVFERSLINLNA